MSQSRFSIVLVGVSALLRRPLVSRLRPADRERSSWVFFAARGCRFDSGFRWAVGLRVHRFRFSACTASELPSASWFFRLPLRSGPRRVGLRAHCFRFSACTDSGWPLGEFVLPPSASEIAAGRVGLRAHCFRFSARTALELPSAGWPSGSLLPLFGTHRFGVALGELAFGLTASAFRHAPFRRLPSAGWFFRSASWPSGSPLPLFGTHRFGDCRWASSFFRLPLWKLPSAGWPSGSLLPLFGMRRSAPPRRRSEDRRSTTTRQLFHFKTLIPTC